MTEERARRKLSGILSADAVGYSRLMQENEALTIRALEDSKRLMSELIEQFKGRVVDAPGDNLLAEFGSVVDATECAVKIQKELKTKNEELPDNRKMQFRIGVNLGDVVEEADRIYGDGVNIAARLEALAEPGGICISRTAYDHVKNKLEFGYEYLGEHSVKNIAEPVRVYRVLMEPEAAGKVIGEKRFLGRISRKTAIIAIIVLVIVAGGLIGWNIYLYQSKKIEPASLEKMAYPLPDKPSIAVLPFDNMSADPEQEYFSAGLTEEIISALSKVPEIFVIARNSAFTYKGKPVKVQQVSEELGVRYVLEGSVRKTEDRVRITAQLIDATNGRHLWSERYDPELKDIFELQDEITMKIINALQVELTEGEQARLFAKGTENLQAYLKFWQAREHFLTMTKEGNALARRLFEETIALDPNYAPPHMFLGVTYYADVMLGTSESRKQSLSKAMKLVQKAIAMDESYPLAHTQLGWLYLMMDRKHQKAIAECERAVALDPNGASAHIWMSIVLRYAGRHEEALRFGEQALRLNPIPPGFYFRGLGLSYFYNGRYDDAIATFKKGLNRTPKDALTRISLVVAYSHAGREDEARNEAAEVLKIRPKYCIRRGPGLYKNAADTELFRNALRKAGLADCPPRRGTK
jgi:adenylate cyclase